MSAVTMPAVSQSADASSQPGTNGKPTSSKANRTVHLSAPAKRSNSGQNRVIAVVSSMHDVNTLAKQAAKELFVPAVNGNDTATINAYWHRVDTLERMLATINSPALRKAFIASINACLALEGKTSIGNQDFRHWACAARVRKLYPDIKWSTYGENAMEKTALKWFSGSFTDLIDNGIETFAPRTDKVKMGEEEVDCNYLIDNLAASMEKYGAKKKKTATKLTRKERVQKSAGKLVKWMKKEYSAEKGELTAFILQFIHELAQTKATETKQDGTQGMTMLEVYQAAIGE